MRASPEYLAEVSDIARDYEAGTFPCSTIDEMVALVAVRYDVPLADVQVDLKAAIARRIANQPVSPQP